MSQVLFITCRTWGEIERCAEKAIAVEGQYAIASASGLLILKDKSSAVAAFAKMTNTHMVGLELEQSTICEVKDNRGNTAIASLMGTRHMTLLYGIPPGEYADLHELVVMPTDRPAN